MKQNKWKKIVTSVLLFVILFSALCTISTLGYDITLVYAMPDGGQHRVRNPFVKAEILFLVTTLGEGVRTEDSLDLQRTSLAHGGEEFLTIRQNGKVTVYKRITNLNRPRTEAINAAPFCYEESSETITMWNFPYPEKWQVDWFRNIFDRYYDYSEGWYQNYERAVENYHENQ